jgi:hypothetical protein
LNPYNGSSFETRRLNEKENTKQDQLHDNKEVDEATSTSGIKDKLHKKCKYDDSYLQFRFMCVGIPLRLMPNVYYVMKPQEKVPWLPHNYNGIYIQVMLIALDKPIAFLNVNLMN